jgi:hypothetical protein
MILFIHEYGYIVKNHGVFLLLKQDNYQNVQQDKIKSGIVSSQARDNLFHRQESKK